MSLSYTNEKFNLKITQSIFSNPLPTDKILEMTKLKAFADDKLNVAEMSRKHCGKKGEYAGHQHFLLFPQCFPKRSSFGVVKSRDCVVKSYRYFLLPLKVPIAANWKGVCLQNISKPHSYHLKIW